MIDPAYLDLLGSRYAREAVGGRSLGSVGWFPLDSRSGRDDDLICAVLVGSLGAIVGCGLFMSIGAWATPRLISRERASASDQQQDAL